MERQAEAAKGKEKGGRDETKPGTIVAGPEAHAREKGGQDPSAPKPGSAKDTAKKQAGRS
ncbi:hypothetical protein [Shinella zoogloeoides]|uniref:hypothetical protein n=1 Tax=Shinella zoogloeoides TaxID=352475 RepID=UPI000E659F40|nr:hypothetical protein [Shinella zoogloeoides]